MIHADANCNGPQSLRVISQPIADYLPIDAGFVDGRLQLASFVIAARSP